VGCFVVPFIIIVVIVIVIIADVLLERAYQV
jgi:hypothetical protein